MHFKRDLYSTDEKQRAENHNSQIHNENDGQTKNEFVKFNQFRLGTSGDNREPVIIKQSNIINQKIVVSLNFRSNPTDIKKPNITDIKKKE